MLCYDCIQEPKVQKRKNTEGNKLQNKKIQQAE